MRRPLSFILRAEQLDARIVPIVSSGGFGIGSFVTTPTPAATFAIAPAFGSSQVQVFNPDGTPGLNFAAYDPGYTGGTFVASGDVTRDGVNDVVTSTDAGGTANIRVFDGRTGGLVSSFFAYPEGFTGGANVAVGDVNGDGFADVVTGVGSGGGPNVRVFSGFQLLRGNTSLAPVAAGGALLASFFAYPEAFTGGVRVAVGNVDGDRFADVIVGAGAGGGPNVRTFSGLQLSGGNTSLATFASGGMLLNSFFALPDTFTGGTFVSAGDVNGDGLSDIMIGVGPGGGPNVRAFDARTTTQLRSFFPLSSTLTGGVRVAGSDVNGDGISDFVVGSGPGSRSFASVFSGVDGSALMSPFAPFGASTVGVNVG
jgi:hypothetical protein